MDPFNLNLLWCAEEQHSQQFFHMKRVPKLTQSILVNFEKVNIFVYLKMLLNEKYILEVRVTKEER